jgi:membrane protein insertase Oxa1/YidC/SpoIIIJ
MNVQMRYILPLIMFPIAYISSVIALYLITTNLFMTAQELFVKRKMERAYFSRLSVQRGVVFLIGEKQIALIFTLSAQ